LKTLRSVRLAESDMTRTKKRNHAAHIRFLLR
jgi:hypothetical protein